VIRDQREERLDAYERALKHLLAVLEHPKLTDGALQTALERIASFDAFLAELVVDSEVRPIPEDQLQRLRVLHAHVSEISGQERSRAGLALSKLRNHRKKTEFYGVHGAPTGASCDLSG